MGLFDIFKAKAPNIEKYFKGIEVPGQEELMVQLYEFVQQGILTPEEAEAVFLQETELGGISTDPSTRAAQMQVQQALQRKAEAGGLDAIARANLREAITGAETEARGREEAIMGNLRARGVQGGGLELANRQLSQQASAQRASKASLETAALAEENRMAALRDLAGVSGDIRGEDYQQALDKARAQDVINQFNAANRQAQIVRNIEARNEAERLNLAQKQATADANVAARQAREYYHSSIPQTLFQNQLNLASAKAGAAQQQHAAQQAASAGAWGAIGGVVGLGQDIFGLGTSIYDRYKASDIRAKEDLGTSIYDRYKASDIRAKEDIEEFSPSEFLDDLVPSRYRYRDPNAPGAGPGEQVGIMSRDLKRVAPQAVIEDRQGMEYIDQSKLTMPMLAALADLAGRVKNLERTV